MKPPRKSPQGACRNCGLVVESASRMCPHCGVSTGSSGRVHLAFRIMGLVFLTCDALVTGTIGDCFVDFGLFGPGPWAPAVSSAIEGLALLAVAALCGYWFYKIVG